MKRVVVISLLTLASTLYLINKCEPKNLRSSPISFTNVTKAVGLSSQPALKYGGPVVADFNQDGRYDLLISNHNTFPTELYWGTPRNTFKQHSKPIANWDVHGLSAADFDSDRDLDIVVAKGGNNGKKLNSLIFLKNENNSFVDASDDIGLPKYKGRGRSSCWGDFDTDGDLDLLAINLWVKDQNSTHFFFENVDRQKLSYRPPNNLARTRADKCLVTNLNKDRVPDIILFSPLSFWIGGGDFDFVEVTDDLLPKGFKKNKYVNAVAEADIDHDGDMDLYLARGLLHESIAKDTVFFNTDSGRVDLADNANLGRDRISFFASDDIILSDFHNGSRVKNASIPLYLGASNTKVDTPKFDERLVVSKAMASGMPDPIGNNGWFLGYLGDNKWRLEWNLVEKIVWDFKASIHNVESVQSSWIPSKRNLSDVLLIKDGSRYRAAQHALPPSSEGNNRGVITADFNNDGFDDFFVYRFGKLVDRVADALLVSVKGRKFREFFDHGGTVVGVKSHGDMGSAFDYNLDGCVDVLSGDNHYGKWNLFKNIKHKNYGNYVLITVGYSPSGLDPLGAEIKVKTKSFTQSKRVGSSGTSYSGSLLGIVHFGLDNHSSIDRVSVRWRNGEQSELVSLRANQQYKIGD